MQHPQAKLDTGRHKLIHKALQGYSKDELREAITGCSLTSHSTGQNDCHQRYDGFHVILQDADQTEKFRMFTHGSNEETH